MWQPGIWAACQILDRRKAAGMVSLASQIYSGSGSTIDSGNAGMNDDDENEDEKAKRMSLARQWDYYVHMEGLNRRLDKWAHADDIKETPTAFDHVFDPNTGSATSLQQQQQQQHQHHVGIGTDATSLVPLTPFPVLTGPAMGPPTATASGSLSAFSFTTSPPPVPIMRAPSLPVPGLASPAASRPLGSPLASPSTTSLSLSATGATSRMPRQGGRMSTRREKQLQGGEEPLLVDPADVALEREHEERTKIKNIDMIQLGKYEVDAWYFSPYPDEVRVSSMH